MASTVFSRMAVYGRNVDGVRVKVRSRGEWETLVPKKTEQSEFCVKFDFGRNVRTVKMRLEFPVSGVVELYEIELPRANAPSGARNGASAFCAPAEDVLWRTGAADLKVSDKYSMTDWFGPGVDVIASPDGGIEVRGRSVHAIKCDAAHRWLAFDIRKVRSLSPGGYTAWQIAVSGMGYAIGCVGAAEPGTYAVKMPPPKSGESRFLTLHTYGMGLEFDGFRTVAEPRAYAVAEPVGGKVALGEGDVVDVTAKMEKSCEDVAASVFYCGSNGASVFQPAGMLSLKDVDGRGVLWKGSFRMGRIPGMTAGNGKPIAKILERQLVVRVAPLGVDGVLPLFAAVPAAVPLPTR